MGSVNSLLNNDGTIKKSATGDGNGVTTIAANFVNNNMILVEQGELQIGLNNDGDTSAGTFSVEPGAIFGVSGQHDFTAATFSGGGGFHMVSGDNVGQTTISGTYTLGGPLIVSNGTASFTIPITVSDVTVTGGTLDLNSATAVNTNVVLSAGTLIANAGFPVSGTFTHSNGTLDGSGTVTVAGKYTWAGGTQRGSGETIANGGIDITTGTHFLRARTVTINGASTWTRGLVHLYDAATIDNNNVFDIQTDFDMTKQGAINSLLNNDGTITKSLSGDADGVTKIAADFINSGDFSVTSGSVDFLLTFTQSSTGTLFVDIADGSFDVFKITQGATLDGELDINLLGGYEPPVPTMFEIMTFASRTGLKKIIRRIRKPY